MARLAGVDIPNDKRVLISLTYIHRNFKNQLQDTNINQIPGDYGRCLVQQRQEDPTVTQSPGIGPVTDPAKIARIVHWFDALNIAPPGVVVGCMLNVSTPLTTPGETSWPAFRLAAS